VCIRQLSLLQSCIQSFHCSDIIFDDEEVGQRNNKFHKVILIEIYKSVFKIKQVQSRLTNCYYNPLEQETASHVIINSISAIGVVNVSMKESRSIKKEKSCWDYRKKSTGGYIFAL
jgi:uncharacterized protein Veg